MRYGTTRTPSKLLVMISIVIVYMSCSGTTGLRSLVSPLLQASVYKYSPRTDYIPNGLCDRTLVSIHELRVSFYR